MILSQKGKYLIVYSDVGTLCTAVARGATARLNRTSTEKKIMMTLHCDDDDWDLFDFFASGMPFLFLIFEIQFITVVIFRASRREWPFLFFGAGANLRMRFCASSTRAFRLRTDGSFEKVAWRILPCSSFFTSSIMNLQTDFALLKNRLAFISLTCLG